MSVNPNLARLQFHLRLILSLMVLSLGVRQGLAQSQGFLHASGTKVVDGNGKEIQLTGVNLGNWLYLEPWMWGTFFFGSFEDGAGEVDKLSTFLSSHLTPAQISTFWSTYRTRYVGPSDIQQIKGFGWNCVRVPMDYRLFIDKASGKPITTNFVYIDNLLTWCKSNGVYVILDMHSVPGSPYYWNTNNVFTSSTNQAVLANAWTAIAKRYAANPVVAAYDLMNEPVSNGDTRLRDVQVNLTKAIRKVDSNHLIFAEGDWYDSSLDILGVPWDSNLGFSDHNYASSLPNNLPHDQNLATKYGCPLWMGEFGYNSNNWNFQQMQLLNAKNNLNGVDIQSQWTLWSWKANAIWSPYRYDPFPKFQKVVDYVNGGSSVSDADIYAGMMDLTVAVAFSNNQQNKDVVDALVRPTFGNATKAWSPLFVPGTIPAVQYDLGPEGLAYHDSNSSNQGGMGSGFQSWNNGWTFRNDGVDIATYVETNQTKYAIGWIDAGEWTQYTTGFTPGNYKITIRYSGTGGTLHLEVNGHNISGPIALPPSPNGGSTTTYTNYLSQALTVTAFGQGSLRTVCEKPGYNLASVQFSTSTSAVPSGKKIRIFAFSNNDYVVSSQNSLTASEASAGSNGKQDQFNVVSVGGNLFALQSVATGTFITLSKDPANPLLIASAKTSTAATQFTWVDAGNKSFYLYVPSISRYVSADQFLGNPPPLSANRTVPQGWETFQYSIVP